MQTGFCNSHLDAWYPVYFKWFAGKAVCVMCDPIILACVDDDVQLVKSSTHSAHDAERQMNLSGRKIAECLCIVWRFKCTGSDMFSCSKEIVSDG